VKPAQSDAPKTPIERDPALRTDRFITWVMLGFAVIQVLGSLSQYSNMVQTLSAVYQQFVAIDPEFDLARYPDAAFATLIGQITMTLDAGILGFTAWWAITRMNANRRAFWVPIVGWLVSTFASVMLLTVALNHDPAFIAELTAFTQRVAENGLPAFPASN
jgi:hypothetical protein